MYLRYSNMQYAIWKLHLCSFYEKKVGAIFGILIVIATTYMSPVFFASSLTILIVYHHLLEVHASCSLSINDESVTEKRLWRGLFPFLCILHTVMCWPTHPAQQAGDMSVNSLLKWRYDKMLCRAAGLDT